MLSLNPHFMAGVFVAGGHSASLNEIICSELHDLGFKAPFASYGMICLLLLAI